MRRDAVAIALYCYLTLAMVPTAFHLLPAPGVLQGHSDFFNTITTGSLLAGCMIAAVGRFWKDELDGGAIEQFGLVAAVMGFGLFIWAYVQFLPMGWFGLTLCGGFVVAFVIQWWLIRRWRTSLRLLARGSDGR